MLLILKKTTFGPFISISLLAFHQFILLSAKNVNQLFSPYELTINDQSISYPPSSVHPSAIQSKPYDINLIEGRTDHVPQTRYPFDSPQLNENSIPGPYSPNFTPYQSAPFGPKFGYPHLNPMNPFAPNYQHFYTKRYGTSNPMDTMDMAFHNSIPLEHGPSQPCNCVPVSMCKSHPGSSHGNFYGHGHAFPPLGHHPSYPMAHGGLYDQKSEDNSPPPMSQSTDDQQKEQEPATNSTKSYDRKGGKYGPLSECGYKRICCQSWTYSPTYGPSNFPPMTGYFPHPHPHPHPHHHPHDQGSSPGYFHQHGHSYNSYNPNPYYSYSHSSGPSQFGPQQPRTFYPTKSYSPNYFGHNSYGPNYNFGYQPYSSAYSTSPQEIYSPNSQINYLPRYSSHSSYSPNSLHDQASQKMIHRANDSMTVPSLTREVTTLPSTNNSSGSSRLAPPSLNYYDS